MLSLSLFWASKRLSDHELHDMYVIKMKLNAGIFRSMFPCLQTKQTKFNSLDENDVYWSEEPLVDHADAEDMKQVPLGSFPCGEFVSKTHDTSNQAASTPATVIASPSDDRSTACWATFNDKDETGWVDATANGSNNIFSAEKRTTSRGSSSDPRRSSVRDAINEVYTASSDLDDDLFDSNTPSAEPSRRLFSAEISFSKSPTSAMDFPAHSPTKVSSPKSVSTAEALNASTASRTCSRLEGEKITQVMDSFEVGPGVTKTLHDIDPISPPKRDTQPRQRRSTSSKKKKIRHDDLVDIVCAISKKCSDLQHTLEEKDSDIERLKMTHAELVCDLEQSRQRAGRNGNRCINQFTIPHDDVGGGESKVLRIALAANIKLEKALKSMQETANSTKKTLDRTTKDHEIELVEVCRHHNDLLNEQRVAYSNALRSMRGQMSSMSQEMQELKAKNHDLELNLEATKSLLHEEAAQRAQENLNHVYETMDMTRDHEIRIAHLKKERASLLEQVEEGHLKVDELKMSLELVRADAEYAAAKLERTTKAHQNEVRSLTKASDDRFFMMMATRERECYGLNQKLNGMFDAENDLSPGKRRSNKVD